MTRLKNCSLPSFLLAMILISGWALAADENVVTPTRTIDLFNGRDLSNFYTWLADYRFEDPHRVFSVVDQIDGAPAIRISGEHWGGIITREAYANYYLIAEFRWGSLTWGRRKNSARDSGILIHCQGPEGNAAPTFDSPWMHSFEYQIIEGGTGDLILVRGYNSDGQRLLAKYATTAREGDNGQVFFDPEGELKDFEGRGVRWFGRDPDWKGVLGFRGRRDVENPVGLWNRIEIIAKDNNITYLLNGVVVNKMSNPSLRGGKLLFQSEGAEIFFRRIELRPLAGS